MRNGVGERPGPGRRANRRCAGRAAAGRAHRSRHRLEGPALPRRRTASILKAESDFVAGIHRCASQWRRRRVALFNERSESRVDSRHRIGASAIRHHRFSTDADQRRHRHHRACDRGRASIAGRGLASNALGIHIEGPFLNWARRGVHDPKHLRRLDNGVIALLCSLRGGRTVLTLAPEMTTKSGYGRATHRRGHSAFPPGHERCQLETCANRPRPSSTACAVSHICSMPWRRWRRANPVSSARRSTIRRLGAASSSTGITWIRSC